MRARAAILALSAATLCGAQPESPFAMAARVERAVVATGPGPIDEPASASPMLRRIAGVLDVLEGPRLESLLRSVPRRPPAIGRPPDGQTVCYLHLHAAGGTRIVEVSRDPTGLYVAQVEGEAGVDRPARGEVNAPRFERLSEGWSAYLGPLEGVEDPLGRVLELPGPYTSHRIYLDEKALGTRLAAGARWRHGPAERDLARETFFARLPAGYTPKRPAGILVWVDPTDAGRPPATLHAAADELNLICIGAVGAGNRRPVSRRYQLALDAVATASRRWHTDAERVYITGMSGGGRVSSIMLGCFPDIFTGAVPIVGLSVYEPVPQGTGEYWRPEYVRSSLFTLFKTRRIAPITGDRDFNQREMLEAAKILAKDGVGVRFFDIPGLGHEMPTAETFLEAMTWVDEPVRSRREEAEQTAKALLDEHAERSGPLTPADVARLERITELHPWGESAWAAALALPATPSAEHP